MKTTTTLADRAMKSPFALKRRARVSRAALAFVAIFLSGFVASALTSAPAPAYTSRPEPIKDYPDTGGKELTDGEFGESSFHDERWVGWYNWIDATRVVSITFDFGKTRKFSRIRLFTLNFKAAGINPIEEFVVSFSKDGETFENETTFNTTDAEREPGEGKIGEPVTLARDLAGDGRWVKIELRQLDRSEKHPWIFLSEVEFDFQPAK